MSIPGWKTFSFFDSVGPTKADELEIPGDTTCCCKGSGQLHFGCSDGTVCTVDRNFRLVNSWPAHTGKVTCAQAFLSQGYLLTTGEEDSGVVTSTLKLWNLNKLKPSTGHPELVRGVKLFNKAADASQVTQLSALFLPAAAHGGGRGQAAGGTTTAAVGLAGGAVLVLRGDMAKDRLQRGRVDLGHGACTGLELACRGETGEDAVLFIATERAVASTRVSELLQPAGQRPSALPAILDEEGAGGLSCCGLSPKDEFAVGRTAAVYFFHPDGRGACFAFPGKKQHLCFMRHYLVLVSEASAGPSKGLAAGISGSPDSGGQPANFTLTVQDLRNKLCAAKVDIPAVRHVAAEGGTVLAILEDGGVLTLKERDLSQKLGMMLRKNMYTVALQLAHGEEADAKVIADVQHKYGDHLYSKSDYDAAMAAYVETIGHLEPSYVIRKFLDVQRIHNLTHYLEELHRARRATADHTTLLLNCYTKVKDIEKLDAFIAAGEAQGAGQSLSFDTETAVKVCRAAGYYEHALRVALQANEPTWYLDVLVEDCGHYDEALKYISGLPRAQATETLQKYGKALVNHRPEETTAVVMKLCTPMHSTMDLPSVYVEEEAESVATFAHLYADRPLALMLLCEYILNSSQGGRRPGSEALLYHTLMDLYLSPELMDCSGPSPDSAPQSAAGTGPSVEERRAKALELLQLGWPNGEEPRYDMEHMLILCRIHSFRKGLLFLYEQKRLYREVLGVYMEAGDYSGLIDACMRLGNAAQGGDPQLWTEVLAYFAERPGEECVPQLEEVIGHIENGQLLPPLVVLQTLSKNPDLKMGIIKDYIGRQLAQSNASIQADRESIAKYQAETERMHSEASELRTKARVFQASKCALTGAPLELPAVHFLCGHSFSLRSLGENDSECPLCSPHHRTVLDIRRSMRAGAMEQDKFFTQLKNSADGFNVVAEFFGRGLISSASHR